MAQFLAKQKPPIKIPDSIFALVRNAINLRRRCSDWFLQNEMREEELRESLQKHSHFIGVLEDVLRILESSSATAATHDLRDDLGDGVKELNLDATTPHAEEDNNNPYDVLYIDDDTIDHN